MFNLQDSAAIFRVWSKDQRWRELDGFDAEILPFLSRYTAKSQNGGGMVAYARLPQGREDEVITDQINHFKDVGQDFEWKVYAFDAPADLKSRLEQRGFQAGPVETFCVRPLNSIASFSPRQFPGINVRRVNTEAGFRDFVRVNETARQRKFEGYFEALMRTHACQPYSEYCYCAYAGIEPIGCGRICFMPESPFAGLYGGAVLPEFRGKGIYSALYLARLQAAQERGVSYLVADAAPMSRPILVAKGFVPVCETWPMEMNIV